MITSVSLWRGCARRPGQQATGFVADDEAALKWTHVRRCDTGKVAAERWTANLLDETKVIAAIDRGEQALRTHGVGHEGRDR